MAAQFQTTFFGKLLIITVREKDASIGCDRTTNRFHKKIERREPKFGASTVGQRGKDGGSDTKEEKDISSWEDMRALLKQNKRILKKSELLLLSAQTVVATQRKGDELMAQN